VSAGSGERSVVVVLVGLAWREFWMVQLWISLMWGCMLS